MRFYSENIEKIKPSGIRRFAVKAENYPDAVSLTLGQPDFNVPLKIREAMKNAIDSGKTHYTSNEGIFELRSEISKYLKKLNINYDSSEIIVTVGGSEGLMSVLGSLINKGDRVLIPSPAYPAYESIVRIYGGECIFNKLKDDFTLNTEALEKQIKEMRIKVLVLSFPSNPTGAVLSKENLNELHRIIKENDIAVVTDEMYASILFEDNYYSVAQFDDIKNKVILIGGFSKIFSMTGLRIGYVCAGKMFIDNIYKAHQYAVSCAPSISQWGALEGLRNCMDDAKYMKNEFKRRSDYVYSSLVKMGFDVVKPRGTFYIFPSIKKFNLSSEDFCDELLKNGKAAVVPGSAFGVYGEGYIRISCCYSDEKLKEAMKRIEKFIRAI